jgi:PAS domain S-box-containing protein
MEAWPHSLKTAVGMMATTRHPVFIFWGPELICLYNDAYAASLGPDKHPAILGMPAPEAFPEAYTLVASDIAQVMAGGESIWAENKLVPITRDGQVEEVFWTYSFSPVLDPLAPNGVGGVIVIISETTKDVVARRESEQRYRTLFETIEDGFCVIEMLFDSQERPVDYRFLEVNPAFQQQTGIKDATGKTVRELGLGLEQHWFEIYGRVALTGEPARFEDHTEAFVGRWFDVYAFRVGVPEQRRVGVLFSDVTTRHRAEVQLRESEERLRLAAEVAGFGTFQYDVANDQHVWAAETYRVYGLEEDAPLSIEAINSLIHPEDRASADRHIAAAIERGDTELAVEHRIIRPDGAVRHVALRSRIDYLLNPGSCQPRRIIGAVQDVTAAREAQRELQSLVAERTAERDRLWQLSPDLMCVAQTDGTLLSVNPAWQRLLGWPTEWLEGRNAAEIKHPGDAERTAAELSRLAAGGHRTINFEDRYRTADGRWLWISWVCEPEDEVIYCIGRDVTAERTARDALAAAEAARREADGLYRAYFENTAEALFIVGVQPDGSFTLEELNPAHEAATGLKIAELRGKRLAEQLPPEAAEAVSQNYQRAVETGHSISYREVLTLPAGSRHWDTVLVPVKNAEGTISRLIGSGRDVTTQVLAEEALRQAQKMEAVGQLTGGIAHDFNNLLGAMIGGFDLIRRKPTDPERVKRYAEAGMQAAERGAKLTGQLLAFSRAQRIEQKPVMISPLVAGMRDMLDRALGPLVRIRLDIDGDGSVLSDPTQLEMAVLNLAINARDAMPAGGELTITTSVQHLESDLELAAGEYVVVSVTDTGSGMSPATLARAFDPFFTTKGVGKGTGLGLSQVYGVAKQTGGTVRIESKEECGTTVRILLPKTDLSFEAVLEVSTGNKANGGASATVLVVDDDPDMRRVVVDALEALGFDTLEAEDGPRGLAALDAGSPDMLLVDFAMPGMNGAEVAREARMRRPNLPIVFASGYADTVAIEEVVGKDATVLRKPFRIDELQAVLAEALSG